MDYDNGEIKKEGNVVVWVETGSNRHELIYLCSSAVMLMVYSLFFLFGTLALFLLYFSWW